MHRTNSNIDGDVRVRFNFDMGEWFGKWQQYSSRGGDIFSDL